jgi:diamine N-acetyltransferase
MERIDVSIVGDRVALGPLRPELFPLHVEWVNDPEVGWNIFGSPQSRTLEEESGWLERESADPANLFFLIYAKGKDGWRPIGVTSLTAIDLHGATATFRILIGARGDRGRGYGTEAMRLVLAHGFGTLGLRTVTLDVFAFNERAMRIYEQLGFRETDRHPERIQRNGRLWDTVVMTCSASEFLSRESGASAGPGA